MGKERHENGRRSHGNGVECLEDRLFLSTVAAPRGGVVTSSFTGGPADAYAVAVQQDGKLVVGGTAKQQLPGELDGSAVVARYNLDGTPDATFGTRGQFILPRGQNTDDVFSAVAIQQDGKIIAAGTHGIIHQGEEDPYTRLVRLNADGTVDQAFDSNVAAGIVSLGNSVLGLSGLVIQSDGKILVVAEISDAAGNPSAAVIRFDPDGTLDSRFGTGGLATASLARGEFTARPTAMTEQPDGKILVGYYALPPGSSGFKFGVLRLDADGSVDTSFGTGGRVVISFTPYNEQIQGLCVAPDGKIIAVGFLDQDGPNQDAIARYNSDGSLDQTFGQGGKLTFGVASESTLSAVVAQADGSIVAAGQSDAGMTLVRLRPDGSFDPTFGSGGKSITQIANVSVAESVALLGDGRIVAAGFAANQSAGVDDQFAVARFTAAGKNDPTFGVQYDINRDGSLDFGDLLVIAQNYGKGGAFADGDLNGDGAIGFDDLLLLAQHYDNASATAVDSSATKLARRSAVPRR